MDGRVMPRCRRRRWALGLPLIALVLAAAALGSTGALTPKGCVGEQGQATGCSVKATGLSGTPPVIVATDGKSVYAASSERGAVAILDRAGNGGLTPAGCIAGTGINREGCAVTGIMGLHLGDLLAISGDGTSLYVGSEARTGESTIVHLQRNPTTGALSAGECVGAAGLNSFGCPTTARLGEPLALALSADGKSLYAGTLLGDVVHLQRNTSTGALTNIGCVGETGTGCSKTDNAITEPYGLAISADGTSLYEADRENNSIALFGRDTTAGTLTVDGCIGDAHHNRAGCTTTTKGLSGLRSIAIGPNGKSLYVAGFEDNAVATFRRDTTTGALTAKGCIAAKGRNRDNCQATARGLTEPDAIAVSPDGRSVYVASEGDSAIVRFARDPSSGKLTSKGCIAQKGDNPAGCSTTTKGLDVPEFLAASSDGNSLYAGAFDAVVRFNRAN